jgi:hypothetical protein
METRYLLGCDPGWKNWGSALLKEENGELELVHTWLLNPSTFPSVSHFAEHLWNEVSCFDQRTVSSVVIERFVPFGGQATAEAEAINHTIGSLCGIIRLKDPFLQPLLVRSVEWKTALVKALVKTKGFDNPSATLDKKFSFAAAEACLDFEKLDKERTDHEADSICLAAYPQIMKNVQLLKKLP